MALRYRATAALAKGVTMGLLGLCVAGVAIWHAARASKPEPITMGAIGCAALAVNALCFILLWTHRTGDANMWSAWICSRNDVLGNLAVLLAAFGVFGTSSGWPDVIVAGVLATLALQGSLATIRLSNAELRIKSRPVAAE